MSTLYKIAIRHCLFKLGILMTWLFLAMSAHAAPDQSVFGPKQYVKNLLLDTVYNDTFNVPTQQIVAPFVLKIENGNADGSARVSSATITINGIQVISANDFDGGLLGLPLGSGTQVIEKSISLAPSNSIQIRLSGLLNGKIKLTVLGSKPKPLPIAITPNPLSIYEGAIGEATVTLSPSPVENGNLTLNSNNPSAATVQAAVGFSAGQSSVAFPVTGASIGNAVISASINGGSASTTVQVTQAPPTVTGISPTGLSLSQGSSSELSLNISAAQTSPVQIPLSSSNSQIAGVPSSITIPAGQTSGQILVTAFSPGTATISAGLNGSTASSQITVTPAPVSVISIEPIVNRVALGAQTEGVLSISSAQVASTTMQLSASPSSIVSLPQTVTIPAGELSAPFHLSTIGYGTAGVTASLNGSSAASAVHVTSLSPMIEAIKPESIKLSPNATASFEVSLNAAPASNTEIKLKSDNSTILSMPSTVIIPAGKTSASFTITGLSAGAALITAELDQSAQIIHLNVGTYPAVLETALPSPLYIQRGATSSFNLNINAVQSTDQIVNLSINDAALVQVPVKVTIPMGQNSVFVPVLALSNGSAVISASLNNTTLQIPVEISQVPPILKAAEPQQLTIAKGVPKLLRLNLDRAPIGPVAVQLSSSNASIAEVPIIANVAAGKTYIDIPVLARGEGSAIVSAALNGSTLSAAVTVTEPELVSITLSPQSPIIYVGETMSFIGQGYYSDASIQDITSNATWTSSNPDIATIVGNGAVKGVSPGKATVTATVGNITATTIVDIRVLPSLGFNPESIGLKVDETTSVTVTSSVPAGTSGLLVNLTYSGSGSVTIPPSVMIPNGQSSITFNVTAVAAGQVSISANAAQRVPATLTATIIPKLAITGINPDRGEPGSLMEITGSGFSVDSTGNSVKFSDQIEAVVVEASATNLKIKVPPTAQTGPIAVSTSEGSAISPTYTIIREQDFSVTAGPITQSLLTGAQAVYTVELTNIGTKLFTGLVALKAIGLPPGVSAKFAPQNLALNQTGELILTADANAPNGLVTLHIEAEALVSGVLQKRTTTVDANIQSGIGVTGIKGRFITPDGVGIPGVRVGAGWDNQQLTITDVAGNFLMTGLSAGKVTLHLDATPAHPLYPIWPAIVELEAGKITVLPDWVINPPPADEKFTPINNATQDQIITDARYPGLQIKMPAGVTITGWDGVKKTRIAVERIEAGRLPAPPAPVPTKEHYQLYFGTPMGGIPDQPIPVAVPNVAGMAPGEKTEIWYFDGSPMNGVGEWKIAGTATVSADGTSIATDPGTGIPRFCGVCGLFSAKCPPLPKGDPPPSPPPPRKPPAPLDTPKPPPSCPLAAGNPVELYSGYEKPNTGGLSCSGLVPVELGLSYSPVDIFQDRSGLEGSFGQGWFSDYEITLASSNSVPDSKRLLLPSGAQINFARQADGSFTAPVEPGYDGAVLKMVNGTWELKQKSGSIWRFGVGDGSGITAFFLTEAIDPQGNSKYINRRSDYKITSVGTNKRAHTYTYGANNLVSQITDPAGRSMRFTYNAAKRIESITNADGEITRYTYVDDNEYPASPVCTQGTDGLRIKTIEYPGITTLTENFHGTSRRVLRQTSRLGETRFAYTVTGACITHVDEPTKICSANCPKEDSWETFQQGWRFYGGQVIATRFTEPSGKETKLQYNSKGVILTKIDPDGIQTKRTLDAQNRVIKETDLLGRTARYTYDSNGNVVRYVDWLGRQTETVYDPITNLPTQITRYLDDGTSVTEATLYDNRRLPIKYTDAEQRQTKFEYSAQGQLLKQIDPLNHELIFGYNDAGDLVTQQDSVGNIMRFTPDGAGRVIKNTTPKGFEWNKTYTGLSQPKDSIDPLEGKIEYAYDAASRLTSIKDQNGNSVQRYSYDERGNLSTTTDANNQNETYQYDSANRLISTTTRKGEVIQYEYDIQDRIKQITRPDGQTDYSYDAVGRLIQISEGNSRIIYTWDNADRLIREVTDTPNGYNSVEYQYDTLDRRIRRTVNGIDPITYQYDKSGLPTSMSFRGKITSYSYDAAGRLVSKTLPNGIKQMISYDAAGKILELQYLRPN